MEYFDNPAGRLYLLLKDLSEIGNIPLVDCWAQVLEVSRDDVPFALGTVAPLLKEIETRVEETGSRPMKAAVRRYREDWSRPIVPIDHPLSTEARRLLLNDVALEALDSVAEHLHMHLPDGRVPDSDTLEGLSERLDQLKESVSDSDLPDDLKNLILGRLSQIAVAISRIRVSGPGEVKASVEALIGAIATSQADAASKGQALNKVWATSLAIMSIFSFGTDVVTTIEGSSEPVIELVVENSRTERTAASAGSKDSPTESPRPRK